MQIDRCCQSLGLEKTGSDYLIGVEFPLGGNENVLNLIEVVVIPRWECTKCHCIVDLKMINFMLCEFDLKFF